MAEMSSDTTSGFVRLMLHIRNRYHPLFRLRRFRLFQLVTRALDLPVAVRYHLVPHPLYVSLSKNLSSLLTRGAAAEEGERENFIWILNRAGFRSFVDVGANVGVYGFLFGALVPGPHVIFVEPDRSNARLIRRTIAASKSSATLVEAAISDRIGDLDFHRDTVTGATGSLVHVGENSFISTHHNATPTRMKVRVTTLDELCRLQHPDFIKIDVEGAELDVLGGSTRILADTRPALMFECDQKQEEVRALLERFGYRFFDMETFSPVDAIPHNCLALHITGHAALIEAVREKSLVAMGH